MGFCLKPDTVYKTNLTPLGVIVIQPVGGNIQLYGTNVTLYDSSNGGKKLIIPEFKDLIIIWDDWIQKDTVNPMNCLTTFIGFKADKPDTVVWVNEGIDIKNTCPFSIDTGQ